ncbi:MAG: HlyD family efflux transporter periplasmic adaptor subunit [Chloroflexota bacterium]
MSKVKIFLSSLMIATVVLSAASCSNNAGNVPAEIPPANQNNQVSKVIGDGNLQFAVSRELVFGTSGTIAEISVSEGDRVTEGQVLAILDTDDLNQALKTAEFAAAAAEIDAQIAGEAVNTAAIDLEQAKDNFRRITYPYTYSTFVFDVPAAIADINTAQRQLNEALEKLDESQDSNEFREGLYNIQDAGQNLTRAKEYLTRGQGIDPFLGDNPQLSVADFWTLRTAQLTMEKAETVLSQVKSNRDKANLAVEKATNDMEKVKKELDKTKLVAPFSGIVASVPAKAGEVLSAVNYNSRKIVDLVDTSSVDLKVMVDELDIARVKTGQKAIVSVDALSETKLDGKVSFISPVASERVGVVMYEVKIDFNIPDGSPVRAGMSVGVEIIVDNNG